jgi:alkylation response protein AidB-like acyl-CoA dehydrogenase
MDFNLSEDQQQIADLTRQILEDKATTERVREVETSEGPRFDRELWSALAEAGLLGSAVPEAQGGAGLGFLEVAAILEQIGRATAPVPFLETVVMGVLPLAEFGSEAQKEAWLPKVAEGVAVLSAALEGDVPVRATAQGDAFVLDGVRLFVPSAEVADLLLVPAQLDGAEAMFLVDPRGSGVSLEALETTSGQPESKVVLEGVKVAGGDRLAGDDIAGWIRVRATAGVCMVARGCFEAALELTSEYIKTRKQFDQPIAMFQAVGHRAADAYIDTEATRLTAWQAAWRLAEGLPAEKQVAVAKIWAAEGGARIVRAAQHLHGGIGVDREYPLHRYYVYQRHLELTLGAGTPTLLALGKMLAAESA